MSDPKRAERTKTESEADRQTSCVYVVFTITALTQNHSGTGPCTDHNEEVHISYVMLISH